MTTLVGPPRERGTLDRMRASVKAVATSPSASTCRAVGGGWLAMHSEHLQAVSKLPDSQPPPAEQGALDTLAQRTMCDWLLKV